MLVDDYRHQGLRRRLVEEIKRKGISDPGVLAAIGKVPRHRFIDDSAFLAMAYQDQAFPIGCGQTISQPYTVAFQSQLLGAMKGEKVLEVGTGCGYQTAVLAELGARVFSIERHRLLHMDTKRRLGDLGYRATLIYGDGYKGAPVEAPFARIIVTCGAPEVPQALLQQLRVGGVLVVPVGAGAVQRMLRITRTGTATWDTQEHGAFSFVPMLAEKEAGGNSL
ncbi:MAG: protein-L-isoaspartate(D-aspartate) O-methyltransferase [Flavobacteriales bacterium]